MIRRSQLVVDIGEVGIRYFLTGSGHDISPVLAKGQSLPMPLQFQPQLFLFRCQFHKTIIHLTSCVPLAHRLRQKYPAYTDRTRLSRP